MRKLKQLSRTWRVALGSLLALTVLMSGFGAYTVWADSNCVSSESGHQTNRIYVDVGGCQHLNGASLYDSNNNEISNVFNNLNGTTQTDGVEATHSVRLTYDFSVHGGAVGQIIMGENSGGTAAATFKLPKNAVIIDGMLDVITACVGGGARKTSDLTMFGITTGAPDYAVILSTGDWQQQCNTAGSVAISQANTAATTTKLLNAEAPTVAVKGTALTAGKMILYLRYFVSA